jgi:phosphatidate cytidylyltransferase
MRGGIAASVRALLERTPTAVNERARLDGARPRMWGDLAPRVLSALVLAPLAGGCAWFGGLAWWALMVACAITLVVEWRGMAVAGRLGLAWFGAGIAYVVVALASLLWLRADPATGRMNVLFLLLVIWATDVGAYLFGRWIGGAKLAPLISPGKTWSGTVGGAVVAMAMGALLSLVVRHGAWSGAAALALVISVAAQLGDLGESAAKRRCGVKDSGRLIPGHGGLLDRVDSLMLAAPVMAALGLSLGRGMVLWN